MNIPFQWWEAASDLLFRWTNLNDNNTPFTASERNICHIVKIKSNQSQKTVLYLHLGYVACINYYMTVKDQAELYSSQLSSHLLRPQTRENRHLQKIYLFCKKWRLVSSISRFVSSASHWFHVWNCHPKNCQLVGLTSQRATSGYHIRQFGDVLCHLISPAPLNFTMILPEHLKKHQTNRKADTISVRISIGGDES